MTMAKRKSESKAWTRGMLYDTKLFSGIKRIFARYSNLGTVRQELAFQQPKV